MIETVKNMEDANGTLTGYFVNGTMSVPLDPANTDYQAVQEWVAEGNTPEEAK
tara:strand:+ start:185 stop:343 length:159 start_codon:yes stop_codon:yes gene_type:complete